MHHADAATSESNRWANSRHCAEYGWLSSCASRKMQQTTRSDSQCSWASRPKQRDEAIPDLPCDHISPIQNTKPSEAQSLNGGSKIWGLSPKFSGKIGGKSFLGNRANWGLSRGYRGLFGANWGLSRGYRGLFGADQDQFLRTPLPRGAEQKLPRKGPFLAQLAPRLDFPDPLKPKARPPKYTPNPPP